MGFERRALIKGPVLTLEFIEWHVVHRGLSANPSGDLWWLPKVISDSGVEAG